MNGARRSLWLLLALAVAPVAAGWLLWLNPQWLPAGRTHHGELLTPPRPVATAELPPWQGHLPDPGAQPDRWTLLLLAERCDTACRQALWDLRQVRLALEEGTHRVARHLVLGAPPDPELAALLEREYPGLGVSAGPEPLAALRRHLGAPGQAADGVYVVDPMGNAMMRYAVAAPAKGLLKDLERLLKISKSWRVHGRD